MTAAGFYHCSVKNVGRTNGRSIVAAAAYRNGERLDDERTGEVFDYRARSGVIDGFILTRDDAPAWAHDRAQLWNEAERAEPRANGRLATELELALPHEFDDAARKRLLKDYLAPIIEKHGIAADVAIHEPGEGKDHRNVHAHVLLTHRQLDAHGFGDIANTRMMSRKRKGREVFEQVAGIAATPADIKAIRQGWEQAVNREYERAGLDIRVDHRSHAERGIEQEPTKHLGPTATEMERRGVESERGAANREITQRNAARMLEAEARDLGAQIIDLKADIAMQAAHADTRGRYDDLRDTHRQVSREEFPGRYDELKAATPPPEVVRAFETNASRTAEPVAPVYDRDADNAAWEAKLADAAIANDAAPEARQPGDAAGRETRPGADVPSGGPENRPQPEDLRPLGKTAGEIRAAWTLSRTAEQLEEALAAHGITLAEVSAEEARQSERTAAFAKEVGNFARVLKEGEIVAVNAQGDVHRLDPRTTGDTAPEIEARLSGIDRAGLLSVTDAKGVMQEAARAAWRDERRAEREQARPASAIETAIADALTATMTGTDFAAALDKAGLTIARANETDVQALDALRQDAALAGIVAQTEGEPVTARHFATILAGDFAAVNQQGDVFRLSPNKLDLDDIEQRLADTQTRMPSVIEARAQNEINREATADLWAELRAWNTEARADRNDAIAGDRALHSTVNAGERGAEDTLHAADGAVNAGLDAASGALSGLAKAVEKVLGGIFSFFGGGEPKLSPMQAELAVRANEELAGARAQIAALQENEAAHDWQTSQQIRQQQQEELEREMGYRERPGDPERERERERDRY